MLGWLRCGWRVLWNPTRRVWRWECVGLVMVWVILPLSEFWSLLVGSLFAIVATILEENQCGHEGKNDHKEPA
jgi:hypothetical protein